MRLILLIILFTTNTLLWAGEQETLRMLHFAGINWYVKNGGPMGPGPNYWSDSRNSVWVDDQGRLHLAIRKVGGQWYCAEVFSEDFTSYGEHRFFVDGYIDRMDKNIVLGLFVYASDNAEIDIEYSKWGYAAKEDVGSFTVQPWSTEGNSHSFKSALTETKTTHFFDWQSAYVLFGSMYGHHQGAPPSQSDYIEQWIYTGPDNPSPSKNLRTHINFWLNNGTAPENLSIPEVIVTDVRQPLSTKIKKESSGKPVPGFELKQNYPNPFGRGHGLRAAPNTVIAYQMHVSGNVLLEIYNILGKKVKRLLDEKQSAGSHHVTFMAKDLISGIYYYKLTVDGISEIRKMVIIH